MTCFNIVQYYIELLIDSLLTKNKFIQGEVLKILFYFFTYIFVYYSCLYSNSVYKNPEIGECFTFITSIRKLFLNSFL